jgi:cytochrome c
MKFPSIRKPILIVLLSLAFAQFACSLGVQPSASGGSQVTQAAPATKSERGTPAEAQAMLQLAVEHYNTDGRDQALADFTAGKPPFKDRDLYVVCMDSSHLETANGGFPQYVGVSADGLLTTDGRPLGKVTWDAASTTSVNSVDYHWINPVSGETEPKTLFFQKVGTDVCGVGAYNP